MKWTARWCRPGPTADSCGVKGTALMTAGQGSWSPPKNPLPNVSNAGSKMWCGDRIMTGCSLHSILPSYTSHSHTHTHTLLVVIFSYFSIFYVYIYNASLQLWGARPALQGAAGSRWTVLRVGWALHVSERAGGLLPLQQHCQGEDRVSAGPRAICQGEQSHHYRILVWFV